MKREALKKGDEKKEITVEISVNRKLITVITTI